MYLQNKQENGSGVPVVTPMPKSYLLLVEREINVFFSQDCLTFYGVTPPLSWRRVVVRFTWEVGDALPKRKGKVALCSSVMTCSSLYIAKLPFR